MSDAQKLIADVARTHSRRIDPNHPNYGNCRCGLGVCDGEEHAEHQAAEIDKALGGLTRGSGRNTGRWVSGWSEVQP